MALVVQKFGGTSVATIDRIKHVAGLIAKTRQAGDTVVVVVSAMSGETDRLVKLAHAITEFPDEREMDMLLSTGERVTIALLAMALGAKVLQSRSVEFAAKYEVPVVVKSTFVEGSGTLVTKEDRDMEQVVVAGVTGDRNQAKVTFIGVPDRPGIAARIFGPLGEANILVDMIIQNVGQADLTDLSFTIPRADERKAVDLANRIAKDIGARSVEVKDQIAKVSLVGVGMRSHSGVAARIYGPLADERIYSTLLR